MSAREETTGKEASIEVKPSYGLTDEEVERMLLDSFEHAEEDVKARLLAEQRVEADGSWRRRARRMAATRPSCSTTASARRSSGALTALAAARAGTDHHAIRAAIEDAGPGVASRSRRGG